MDDVHNWLSIVAAMSNSTDQVLKIEMCRRGNYRNVPQMAKIVVTCFPVTTSRRKITKEANLHNLPRRCSELS